MKIQQVSIQTLIEAEYNPRKLSEDQFSHIKSSLQRFGFVDPVIVNSNPDRQNIIIGGHQRVKVAREIGLEKVPVHYIDLPLEKERELNVRLNKNSGEFDFDLLQEHFEAGELVEWGFTDDEFNFDNENEDSGDEDPGAQEPPEQPRSEYGRIYQLGPHRLMCGDSTSEKDVARLMGGEKADMWITDPPYNVAYEGKTADALTIENDSMGDSDFREFLVKAYKSADSAMSEGAIFYIWHADSEGYNFRGACFDIDWKVRQCLIWKKSVLVMGRQDYHWKHEPCLYGWKDGAGHSWSNDRKQTTILEFDKPMRNGEHPTMKPVELFKYQIKNHHKKGAIILDSFGGSGTTLIASEMTGRQARLMELDPKYCDVIINRYCEMVGEDPDKIFNGESNG